MLDKTKEFINENPVPVYGIGGALAGAVLTGGATLLIGEKKKDKMKDVLKAAGLGALAGGAAGVGIGFFKGDKNDVKPNTSSKNKSKTEEVKSVAEALSPSQQLEKNAIELEAVNVYNADKSMHTGVFGDGNKKNPNPEYAAALNKLKDAWEKMSKEEQQQGIKEEFETHFFRNESDPWHEANEILTAYPELAKAFYAKQRALLNRAEYLKASKNLGF